MRHGVSLSGMTAPITGLQALSRGLRFQRNQAAERNRPATVLSCHFHFFDILKKVAGCTAPLIIYSCSEQTWTEGSGSSNSRNVY